MQAVDILNGETNQLIVIIKKWGETPPCPGYEQKLAEAKDNPVNGLILIKCFADCRAECKANKGVST